MTEAESTELLNRKCFVIMPISDAEGYEKAHFTRVYEHIIKPAVLDAGYNPIRADDVSKTNHIMVDILKEILDCEIAICDLSSRNPNVFYELGVRQAFNKKTVLIKDNKTTMPFDINAIRTLNYSENLRIDEVKDIIPKLKKSIQETCDAPDNEINSLIQLLSIQPASVTETVDLSQETSLILRAVSDLNKRLISQDLNANNSLRRELVEIGVSFKLLSGELIVDGETLYRDGVFFGYFVNVDSENIYIRRKDSITRGYSLSDKEFLNSLSKDSGLPF